MQALYPGINIRIISFHYPFERKHYTWHGVDVYAIGGRNRKKLFALQTWYSAYQTLKQLYQQDTTAGIFSFWITDCALVGHYFSKRYHARHLTWIIGQDARAGNRHVRRIRPEPGQLVAMSDFLQDTFEANYGIRPLHVVPNGINDRIFPGLNKGDRNIDVFGAGSLIPLKNYRLFIEIIALLKKDRPGIKACIAGDGEERESLWALVKQLGLENNMVMPGRQSHAEVLQLMNNSRVFLHTSHYEGNSTVLAEALYSGCMVVSTQALSKKSLPHLFVAGDKEALTGYVSGALQQDEPCSRVTFNTMDQSARQVMQLFLQ